MPLQVHASALRAHCHAAPGDAATGAAGGAGGAGGASGPAGAARSDAACSGAARCGAVRNAATRADAGSLNGGMGLHFEGARCEGGLVQGELDAASRCCLSAAVMRTLDTGRAASFVRLEECERTSKIGKGW